MSGGSAERQTVEVTILGETYALKSETTAEYTRRVAEHVDRTAREIREESGIVEQAKLAVLAALAVTDQLFRMREGVEVVKGLAERRAERLAAEVRAVVEQAGGE
jgi:cell division protein ZapA